MEIKKFFGKKFQSTVYEGSSAEKLQIIQNLRKYDIIIISYEKLRNDIKQFASV